MGKRIRLILIVLVFTITIYIWAWEKTPLLSALFPPQGRLLQLSPVIGEELVNKNNEEISSGIENSKTDATEMLFMEKGDASHRELAKKQEERKQSDAAAGMVSENSVHVEEEKGSVFLLINGMRKFNSRYSFARVSLHDQSPSGCHLSIWNVNRLADMGLDMLFLHGPYYMNQYKLACPSRNTTFKHSDKVDQMPPSQKDKVVITDSRRIRKGYSQQTPNGNSNYKQSVALKRFSAMLPIIQIQINTQRMGDSSGIESSTKSGWLRQILKTHPFGVPINIIPLTACNYAKGEWVVDDSWPLYSGFGCKQWLYGTWACRLAQRTDFAYEKLRWRPNNCTMTEFTSSKFLERMQHKTIAFVGDSLGQQQFQSLMCMVAGGKEMPNVLDVGKEYGLVKSTGSIRPPGSAYRFPSTNTTILNYWSPCLADLEPLDITNPLTDYAMHLDRPPAFLQHFLPKFDVLVLKTGHHWKSLKFKANRWVMHVGGVPIIDKRFADFEAAKNFTVYSIVHWVNLQLLKYPGLKAFFRTISPSHFLNGSWNSGGTCDNTIPSPRKEVLQDESSYLVAKAVKGTKVTLMDITALSQVREEGHLSRYNVKARLGLQDCLHWCLPGVPDTWNEILFALL
ncbi:hypothetical protein Vadar_016511 [Vaccinium darrowii]|uniref:Uncharacterized protein n=1 Tax=Vaccinium darrowii TaxID=229202 RepID=A0ACB7XR46_9ERIC|nr:hypothetical protein Vadar_016511 [Vaccinium darrowii]